MHIPAHLPHSYKVGHMFIGSGTVINVIAVITGASLGVFFAHRLSTQIRHVVTDALGLITLTNAIFSLLSLNDVELTSVLSRGMPMLILLGSIIGGGILGSLLGIENRLTTLGDTLKARYAKGKESSKFTEGFVASSLLFSIGPLALMGSISDGLGNGNEQLLLKSTLDFFASIAFAASFGWGVAASALIVGVVQSLFTIFGMFLGNFISTPQVLTMNAVGGILLMGIALDLLNIKRVSVGDMLPALFIAPILTAALM